MSVVLFTSAYTPYEEIDKWQQPASWKHALRRKYPFKCELLELPMFKDYLERRLLDKDTVNQHMLSMSRFVNMFETVDPSEKLDVDNILLNAHHCDLFLELQKLPLCAADYHCTISLTKALAHYAVMAMQVLYKKDDKARAEITKVIDYVITDWSTICNKVRTEGEARKYATDAKMLADYHSRDELKDIARQCYMTLKTIHHNVCEADEKVPPTKELVFKATAHLIGAIFTNSSPNRSKEIQTLDNETVLLLPLMQLQISQLLTSV